MLKPNFEKADGLGIGSKINEFKQKESGKNEKIPET